MTAVEPEHLLRLAGGGVKALGPLARDRLVAGRVHEEERAGCESRDVTRGVDGFRPQAAAADRKRRCADARLGDTEQRAEDRAEAEARVHGAVRVDLGMERQRVERALEVVHRLRREVEQERIAAAAGREAAEHAL